VGIPVCKALCIPGTQLKQCRSCQQKQSRAAYRIDFLFSGFILLFSCCPFFCSSVFFSPCSLIVFWYLSILFAVYLCNFARFACFRLSAAFFCPEVLPLPPPAALSVYCSRGKDETPVIFQNSSHLQSVFPPPLISLPEILLRTLPLSEIQSQRLWDHGDQ
jgi:hypothetical protein